MIVRDHLPWTRIWPQTAVRILLLFVFDFTIAILYSTFHMKFLALNGLPLSAIASALTIFLVFRTNAAYARWWEARQLWGSLVNTSRSIARQALTFIQSDPNDSEPDRLKRLVVLHQIAFVHALRCHLRKQNPFPEFQGILGSEITEELRNYKNVPAVINLKIGKLLEEAHSRGLLDTFRWTAFDENLNVLSNIQGACERIKNTPIPRQFEYFPRLLVNIFCWIVPFGLVADLGLLTPIASSLISFIFIAVEMVGREIETPFENTVHDIPMTNLSRTIEMNLREQMGEKLQLTEVKPIEGFVY